MAKTFLMVSIILLASCSSDKRKLLQGSWHVDSVYSFYNGFGYMRKDLDEEPLQHYQADGRLRMTRGTEFRFFLYEMPTSDSLIQRSLEKRRMGKFLIVKLDQDQLVLRKEMPFVFPGNNQSRYELRYFSRVKE